MISTYKHKQTIWYDLENPTLDEIRNLVDKYNIDLRIAKELLAPSSEARIEQAGDLIYIILHFPNSNSEHISGSSSLNEVDFIIGKNYIITSRYTTVNALLEVAKYFEMNSVINKESPSLHTGMLFYYMIQKLYRALHLQLDNAKTLLNDIEKKVFEGYEKEMVVQMSNLSRLFLRFKETIDEHQEILESFEILGNKFFDDDFQHYIRGISTEYNRIKRVLDNRSMYLNELKKTNDSLLTTKTNNIIKKLTVISFLILPLTLISSIFGMNTENMPITGDPNAFNIIIGLMTGFAILLFYFFKRNKLL